MRRHFRLLVEEFGPVRTDFFLGLLTTFLSAAVSLLLPERAKVLIEQALPQGDVGQAGWEIALMLAIITLALSFSAVRKFVMDRLSHRLATAMRARLFARILSVSPRSLQTAEGGRIMSNFSNDLQLFGETVRVFFSVTLPTAVLMVVFIGAMIWYSWELTAVLMLLALPMAWATNHYGHRIQAATRDSQNRLASLLDQLGEVLTGTKEIKLFEMEDRVARRFEELNRASLKAHVEREFHGTVHPFVLSLVVAVGLGGLILASTYMLSAGMIDVGAVTGFVVCLGLAYPPLQEFANSLSRAMQLGTVMERIENVLEMPPEAEGGAPLAVTAGDGEADRGWVAGQGVARGAIAFEHVDFSYGGDSFAFRDFNLAIAPGERVAIVGPSGAGKSTLLEMLPRFTPIDGGRITIDGVDIAALSLKALRRQIGLVLQVPFLFRGTLFENLSVAAPDAPRGEVMRVAAMARVDEFATKLPAGYDTVIEPGGTNLSVGQRQRIAIARVLLKDPPILLLDEPTSALDSESERHVSAAIRRVSEGRTTVIVAHRLSTVRDVDRVVFLEAGRIVEQGSHDELMAQGGAYAQLCRTGEWLAAE